MPGKNHAVWDRVPGLWSAGHFDLPPSDRLRARAEARTRGVESILGGTKPPDPVQAREIAAELASRFRDWGETASSRRTPPPLTEAGIVGALLLVGATMVVFSLPSALFGGSTRGRNFEPALISLIVGSAFLTVGLVQFRRRRRFLTPIRRFRRGHCPDCNYDLSACPPHPPPFDDAMIGQPVGPRLCPECGALWPLIPPGVIDRGW